MSAPSEKPQRLKCGGYYYEYKNKIIVCKWSTTGRVQAYQEIQIPWGKLIKSARRCKPELFT